VKRRISLQRIERILEAPGRVELPTNGLGNRCSIHLSYGAKKKVELRKAIIACDFGRRSGQARDLAGECASRDEVPQPLLLLKVPEVLQMRIVPFVRRDTVRFASFPKPFAPFGNVRIRKFQRLSCGFTIRFPRLRRLKFLLFVVRAPAPPKNL
jgi:hypothetical protein